MANNSLIPKIDFKLEARVNGLGEVYSFRDMYSISLGALREKGMEPASPRDLAYTMIELGKENLLSIEGGHTSAGFLQVQAKGAKPLLALESPLLNMGLAIRATESERYPFTTGDKSLYQIYLNQAEKDLNKSPDKRKVIILPSTCFKISLNENSDIMDILFKDIAREYLGFTGKSSIYFSIKDYIEQERDYFQGTILTQLFLDGNHIDRNYGIEYPCDNQITERGVSCSFGYPTLFGVKKK